MATVRPPDRESQLNPTSQAHANGERPPPNGRSVGRAHDEWQAGRPLGFPADSPIGAERPPECAECDGSPLTA